jgi:hypothetical protein
VHADGVGDEDAALQARDDVGERRHGAAHDEVGGVYAGQARVRATQAVAGGAAARLAPRVRVVEEALQHAAADQRCAPAGRALAVERGAVEAVGQRAVVHQLEDLAGHLPALAAGEQRAALLHGVGGERRAEHAEERGGHEGVEHHRRLHRRALAGAEQPAGSLGGLAPAGGRVQLFERPAHRVRVARLHLAVCFGEHVGEGVALVGAVAAAHPGAAGDEHFAVAVRVHRVLNGLDPRVGGQGRGFDRHRQRDAALVGRVCEALVERVHVGRRAGRRGDRGELIGVADRGVVDGALHDCVERAVAQVGGVGVAHRAAREDAHPQAAALGGGELLDLLPVDLDAPRRGTLGEDLDVGRAFGARPLEHGIEDVEHQPVPPTVISAMRKVAWPVPTGTP